MDVADRHRPVAEEGQCHARLATALERERRPDGDGHEVPEHRDEREDVSRREPEVHVAVAAEGGAVRLAEEVAEDVGGRQPARVVARLLAVERQDDVVRPERQPGPGGISTRQ